jgi:hypothetical protein
MALNKMKLCIKTLIIMAFCMMTLNITTFSVMTFNINDTRRYDTQHYET